MDSKKDSDPITNPKFVKEPVKSSKERKESHVTTRLCRKSVDPKGEVLTPNSQITTALFKRTQQTQPTGLTVDS